MAKALVFIDNPGGALKKSSRELLTIARSLGESAVAFNGELHDDVAAAIAAHGATAVYRPSVADLDDYLVAPKAAYLAAAVAASGADTVLLENSADGKEIAARLGVKLNAGVITDVVGVDADGTAHKSVLAGAYTTTAKARTAVAVLTVKPNSVDVAEAPAAGTPESVTVEVPADATASAARITARSERPASGRPELTEARVVVAGGRGVDGDFGPPRNSPTPWVARWALPVRPPTPAGSATTSRWARPARPSPRSCTSPRAFPARSSRRPACRPPR